MTDPARASGRPLLTLFAAAFALRLVAVAYFGSASIVPGTSAWDWGHEPACIAQSLVDGRGYSDPWGKGTGATSWLTPPFPVLLAGLFELFGGVSSATALTLHVLQALVSAWTCLALVALGRESGSPRAGILAGWLFALDPIAISNASQLVWDTTFAAAALTGVLLLLVRLGASRASQIRAGIGYGACLLLNPAPLSLAPIVAWHAWRRSRASGVAVVLACAFAVCLPWLVRNQVALGRFSLRPNFGVEMRIGNHAEANGRPVPFRYHPSHVESELALYRELGEVEYARENTVRAWTWIHANPAAFTRLTMKRLSIFWLGESPATDPRRSDGLSPKGDPSSWIKWIAFLATGVAGVMGTWRRGISLDARLLFVGTLILYGTPYYLSHVSERYRFPIEPLLVLLASLVVAAFGSRKQGSEART